MEIISITNVNAEPPLPADRDILRRAVERNEREISGLRLQIANAAGDAETQQQCAERIGRLNLVNAAYNRLLKITDAARKVSIIDGGGFDMNTL